MVPNASRRVSFPAKFSSEFKVMGRFRTSSELFNGVIIAIGDRIAVGGTRGEPPMKCFVCGSEMRLTLVEPHDEVTRPGFEYRTFRCESCGDTERRFVFDPRAAVDVATLGRA